MTRTMGQLRLGIFGFLLATLLVLAALVIFSRYPSLFRRGAEYHTLFANVAGLNVGDDVRYGGLTVGSVTGIEIAPADSTRLLVRFRVRRGTPMRVDTRASITQVGLLGEPYLHLEPGAAAARPLAAGGLVPSTTNLSFQDAMTRLALFFDRADTLLSGAERVARASPLERLDNTLDRMDTLVATATTGTGRVFTQLDTATARLNDLMDRSARLVTQLDTAMGHAGPQLAATEAEALSTAKELHALLGDVRDALQAGGGVGQVVRNMSITADNLARVSERLDRDPTSLLKRRLAPQKPAGPKVRE